MVDQSLLAIINLTLINTKHQKLPVTNCSVQETCVWDLCMFHALTEMGVRVLFHCLEIPT